MKTFLYRQKSLYFVNLCFFFFQCIIFFSLRKHTRSCSWVFCLFSVAGALSHGHVQELPAEERHGRASAVRLRLGRRGAEQREEEKQRPAVRRHGGALLSLRDQTRMADHPPDPKPQAREHVARYALWLYLVLYQAVGALFHYEQISVLRLICRIAVVSIRCAVSTKTAMSTT